MTAAESLDPDESLWHAIAFHLRQERLKRGQSQPEVGEIIGVNKHGVSNLEAGRNKLTQPQAEKLDEAWKTGGLFARLRRFAKLSHDPDWRSRVDRYQREARQFKIFHHHAIPVPLQDEGYATAMLTAGHAAGLVKDLQAAVARRLQLQTAILENRPCPPLVWAVLDDTALHTVRDAATMKPQLEHLLTLSELHHVSIRVVPPTPLPHIGIDGSFWHFDLPGRRSAGFLGTTLDSGRVVDDPGELAAMLVRFDRIAARALNEDQTRELLIRKVKAL